MKASMFYRIAAVLLLLFAAGHTLGFRQSDPTWGVDALLGSMRSIHFDVQGFNRTYWDLFVAAGFSVGVFYLFAAILAWQLGALPAAGLAGLARHSLGIRSLLCRHHGCELEIPLYPTHRFLKRDYVMFDCGGMAFSEAGSNASIAIVRVRGFKLKQLPPNYEWDLMSSGSNFSKNSQTGTVQMFPSKTKFSCEQISGVVYCHAE